jgi:acyl-CoA synthetase (NDP forming)
VVLKARSGDVVHKSDVGGVALGLADSEAVRAAYETMQARLTGGQRWRMAATG